MNHNAHLLMQKTKQNKTKPKTNQNKIKSNKMSMRLLGGNSAESLEAHPHPKKTGDWNLPRKTSHSCFVGIKVFGHTL